MSFKSELLLWDKKSTGFILSLYKNYKGNDNFLDELLVNLNEVQLQVGSTWLIKKMVEDGVSLSSQQTQLLFSNIGEFDHWETKLHFLQILSFLIIPPDKKVSLFDFLREGIRSDKKFVRAWSYSGLIDLADQFPAYRSDMEAYIKIAMSEESASVKARIRRRTSSSKN